MTEQQMRNEKLYLATIRIVKRMAEKGLITEEEYRQIDTTLLCKYRPVFGTLCSENPLT